jgi:hypothetical protein
MSELPMAAFPAHEIDSPEFRASVPHSVGDVSRWAIGVVLLLGLALRLAEFLSRQPLWIDEAFVTLNVGARTFFGLASPLDYKQTAPVPFLWATKTATLIGGVNEFTLRLVPLLCGLALLPVIWRFARRLDRRIALLATLLAALSPLLLRYSDEVKQYGPDALVTMMTAFLVLSVLDQPASRAAWRRLAWGGAAALVLSQPSAFVLAGAGVALVVDRSVRRIPGWAGRLAGVILLWLGVFGLLYFMSYRDEAALPYMRVFWGGTYPTPSAPDLGFRGWRAAWVVLMSPLEHVPSAIPVRVMVPAFLLGLFALRLRTRLSTVIFIGATYGATLAAAIGGRYPVSQRTYAFLAPFLFLVYAAAAVLLCDLVPRRVRWAAYAVASFVLALWPAWSVWASVSAPHPSWNTRRLVEEVRTRLDGAPVYIYALGFPTWVVYTTDWDAPDAPRLRWGAQLAGPGGPAFGNTRSRGHPVRCEGDSLIRVYGGRTEIIGTPTGIQFTEPAGSRPVPDSGWAANEARRIRVAATTTAWMFITNVQSRWNGELFRAVRAAGGRIIEAKLAMDDVRHSAALYRIRFSPATVNPPSRPEHTCDVQ